MSETQFDLVKFINDGFDAQQKYSEKVGELGPRDYQLLDSQDIKTEGGYFPSLKDRYTKVIEMFGHLIEEAIEARVYVPRRSWKNGERSYLDTPEFRQEFIAEMYDILLFHRAILAYAGVTGEEFASIAAQKQAYNQTRKDHLINGNTPAVNSPSAELQGLCPSSNFQ